MSYIANINIKNLSQDVLEKAKAIRSEIDKLEKQLADILSGNEVSTVTKSRRGRPPRVLATNGASPSAPVKRKKRNLSPEARARIVAAVKARWEREKSNKT